MTETVTYVVAIALDKIDQLNLNRKGDGLEPMTSRAEIATIAYEVEALIRRRVGEVGFAILFPVETDA